MELIKITEKEGKRLVSARELYEGLGLDKSNWSRWAKQNIEEEKFFRENEDWAGFVTMTNGNETKDYAVSLEFGKHIAMMARTEKSHMYRNYMVECEKRAKETPLPQTYIEALEALVASEKEKQALALSNAQMKPKAEYFDKLVDRKLNLNFRDTAKELEIGQKTFIAWLLVNSFVYRDSKKQLRPYAQHTPSLFEIKEYTNDNHSGCQTLITPRGRETFSLLLKK